MVSTWILDKSALKGSLCPPRSSCESRNLNSSTPVRSGAPKSLRVVEGSMAASSSSSFESSDPRSQTSNEQRVPARIGKYEVDKEVGCGDLVRVFLAFDRDIDRPVQLKLLTDV